MKLRSPFLFLLLLGLSYIAMVHPIKILKPFYYIKDLVFSTVHALPSESTLSDNLKDGIINNLKEEITSLKKLNKVDLSISEFDLINATIISRNRDYWFNSLTINKGSIDGIEIDMAVIDSNGLIGRISMVTDNTSVVKLITTNDTKNKVSAVIHNKEKDIYGIISGYDSISNYLYLTVTDNVIIEKDSKVETTGMGGVFPRGILIGHTIDSFKKNDDVTNIVRVIPSGDIIGERYVSVLSRKKVSVS